MNKKKKGIIVSIIIFGIILGVGATIYSDSSLKFSAKKFNFFIYDECCRFAIPEILQDLENVSVGSSSTSDFETSEFITGVLTPTQMTFVGDDILLLEKNSGQVRLIRDGVLIQEPIIDFNVFGFHEAGLVGILSVDSTVYLYLTESTEDGKPAIGNHIYKYEWTGENLIDGKLVNILPARDSIRHHGGAMALGNDGTVYAVIGDLGKARENIPGVLQNWPIGVPDDTGVIIRVGLKENELKPSESQNPNEHYYAIGIRNSFGLAVDPVTGNLWQTENGWRVGSPDEINLVFDKFNSGWNKTMGISTDEQIASIPEYFDFVYSNPEFTWSPNIAPTALVFVNERWGEVYRNSLLVGSCNTGNIYKFELNSQRDGFTFSNPDLFDLFLSGEDADDEIVFARNFGCISDLEFGPDNSLYIISHANNGAIYKISPN